MSGAEASTAGLGSEVDAAVRAARVFAGITAESIAQAGERVTMPQLRVLVLASTSESLNNAAVAQALDVHISNASRICDRLVQAGLLHRRDGAGDRRHVELTLTEEGAMLVAAVIGHRREVFTRALRVMSPQQRLSVAEALTAFTEVVEEQLERRDLPIP